MARAVCSVASPRSARSRAAVTCASASSWAILSRSAPISVGSKRIRTSPAATVWPSSTRIEATTAASAACTVFERPDGMVLPSATATTSTRPRMAQASRITRNRHSTADSTRAVGEGGVSVTSSTAGRKASSPRRFGATGGEARSAARLSFSTRQARLIPPDPRLPRSDAATARHSARRAARDRHACRPRSRGPSRR